MPDIDPALRARAFGVRDWLVREARFIDDPGLGMAGLAERLRAAGLPLDRMASAMPTLYATRRGLGRIWERGKDVEILDFPWTIQSVYEASPYFVAHQTREWVGFRLADVADDLYGIVPDLRQAGFSHYICAPLFFSDGASGGITFSTRHPDGFSDDHLTILRLVEPAISIVFEVVRAWRIIRETLQMYVGREPQARILKGDVRRGEVNTVASVIMFADMRGFTALSATMSANETVALLNRYFDCVVPAVEQGGGEVLKYLGDGVLAIFSCTDPTGRRAAGERALAAARAIVDAVDADRAAADEAERFNVKLALHFGEVGYGNVGSGARLDFTVVGAGVNLASRIADLAGTLGHRIVVSSAFADLFGGKGFAPLGAHTLRGIAGPEDVFRPPD